jgi:uncharacterized RDD family membrane protein YckC
MTEGFEDRPARNSGAPPHETPGRPYRTGAGPSGPRASFAQRLLGAFADVILVSIAGTLVNAVFNSRIAATVNFIVGIVYYVYLEGSPSGQTVGKRLANIRVIDFDSGGPIDRGRAAIRYFGRLLSGIVCFLGYFWMLWDSERQTWHDKLANSVVVPTSAYPVEDWPG